MRKFARFAVSFLSLAALPLLAADLRPLKDPLAIDSVFAKPAKVRVLNVWATWCIPCVAEMPDLRAMDEAFGKEVAFAGVTLDDMIPDAKQDRVSAFLDKHGITFPNVYYTGNADKLGEHLKFDGEIPITIVYDRKGKELWRHTGRLDREKTLAQLRDILRRMK